MDIEFTRHFSPSLLLSHLNKAYFVVISRSDLLKVIWPNNFSPLDNSLHIKAIYNAQENRGEDKVVMFMEGSQNP